MNWTDIGLILNCRKHGETSVIIHVFTRDHGRSAGLVRGGAGRRLRGLLQPGNEVQVTWRSRLQEQLGTFTVEQRKSHIADLFEAPLALLASSSAMAVLEIVLPEREPHPRLYEATTLLLASLEKSTDIWPMLYVKWELGLLGEIGYGLDLSACAATNMRENLVYVSPKTGRAVSRDAGQPYHDKLLALPAFLLSENGGGEDAAEVVEADILAGLKLTGYFIEKVVREHKPALHISARERFVDAVTRRLKAAGTSSQA